jgi:nucleoside-diphosphate-sugar epimerase
MTVLLTGITGLVGCHVAIALLQRGIRVIALARGGEGQSAENRAMRTLSAYPGWAGKAAALSNMLVVEGNLLSVGCGISPDMRTMLRDHVDVVLNCAGAITFSAPGDPDPELRVNTDGLSHVIELASMLKCRRLIHVSTAYVDQGSAGAGYRTEYERTKHVGEKLLLSRVADSDLDAVIVRPSIVTGDCRFGFTPVFNGIYPFFRFAFDRWSFLRDVSVSSWLPTVLQAASSTNLVPAGVLGDVIVGLAEAWPRDSRIFTFINPSDWPVSELLHDAADYFHVHMESGRSPLLVSPLKASTVRAEFGILSKVYRPYAAASPTVMNDSDSVVLTEPQSALLRDRQQWLHALLDWGMKVGWKRIE